MRIKVDLAAKQSPTHPRDSFTLAEVLIVLAVIGIVAVLTIPTLIHNIENKILVSQFKKSYAILNNALQLTNYNYGSEYECYTKKFSCKSSQCKEFQDDFFKTLKYVKAEESVSDTSNKLPYKNKQEVLAEGGTTGSGISCSFHYYAIKKYYISNGMVIYANNFSNVNNDNLSVFFTVDINGDKSPNKWGYDVFYLAPTKGDNGSFRFDESGCWLIEKGGKRAFNMIHNTDDVSEELFPD